MTGTVLLSLGLAGALPAAPAMLLSFEAGAPYVADISGNRLHALLHGGHALAEGPRPGLRALVLRDGAWLELPEARLLLGDRCSDGTMALWVRPDFDPAGLPGGTWEGWVTILYIQKRSGNGLPDGRNEIGLTLHGPQLIAKVVGGEELSPFAVRPCPLKQGQWTHLAMTWSPTARRLYVDGQLAAEATGQFSPTLLDDFPAAVGRHPSSGKWFFTGAVADLRLYREPLSAQEVADVAQ
ncbi:MAG: LamG domain-containing protein [Armatimonadota bacterium]